MATDKEKSEKAAGDHAVPGSVPTSELKAGTALDLEAIGKRLAQVRARTGQVEFAAELGVHPNTLGRYERGERAPDIEFLVTLSAKRDVSADWVLFGLQPMSIQEASDPSLRALALGRQYSGSLARALTLGNGVTLPAHLTAEQVREVYAVPVIGTIGDDEEPQHHTRGYIQGEYVYVPMFDVRAGAGHGKIPIGERIVAWPVFMLSFIRDKVKAPPEHLGMGTIDGDSMYPDLVDGSAALFDMSDTGPRRDGIYVLRLGENILVKWIQRTPGGVLNVTSSNPRFAPFTLHERGMEEQNAAIIGRVVWGDRVF